MCSHFWLTSIYCCWVPSVMCIWSWWDEHILGFQSLIEVYALLWYVYLKRKAMFYAKVYVCSWPFYYVWSSSWYVFISEELLKVGGAATIHGLHAVLPIMWYFCYINLDCASMVQFFFFKVKKTPLGQKQVFNKEACKECQVDGQLWEERHYDTLLLK